MSAPAHELHAIGARIHRDTDLVRLVQGGLRPDHVDRLRDTLGVTQGTIEAALALPASTLSRLRRQNRALPQDVSERVLRLARLYEQALELLGNDRDARAWMTSPQYALDDRTPLEFAETGPGAEIVRDVLGRLKDGGPL